MKNFLREKIESGKSVYGIWNTLGSPMVTDVLASSGLDFILIDFEHGPCDLSRISDYVNACLRYDVSPIVRLPELSDWKILQALDQGAHGVIIPHIETKEETEKLINFTKFYPEGKRGYTPFTKAGGYTGKDSEKFSSNANELTLTSIIIESKKGLDNLDDILAVNELDVVFFGSFDLSQELGCPGETRSEVVKDAIKSGIEKVKKAGKCPGAYLANSIEDINWLKELGVEFIIYKVDSSILKDEITNVMRQVK